MKQYIEISYLWKCETCFHHRNGKCAIHLGCCHGEGYRPDYSKIVQYAVNKKEMTDE